MSEATRTVSNSYLETDQVTLSSISGPTDQEATPQAGSKTFNIDEWLGRERSFETTAAHIITCSAFAALIVGIVLGICIKRSRIQTFEFHGQTYQVVALGQYKNGKQVLYTPVYEVQK